MLAVTTWSLLMVEGQRSTTKLRVFTGRRKGSFSGAGWAMALAGGMMAALGLGSIAMMSGKAMMVSMMALMLSALAAFRKGGGGGDQAATTYEVINVPTGHGHHHARRYLELFNHWLKLT